MRFGKREAKRLGDLLLMRKCVRGSPYRLLERLRDEYDQKISQKGAGKKIATLEKYGYIRDYIPIIDPSRFGDSFLVCITFDDTYKDVLSYLESINSFLETKNGFAQIVSYSIERDSLFHFYCIIVTEDISQFIKNLQNNVALSSDIITWEQLNDVKGIPDYDKDSISIQSK